MGLFDSIEKLINEHGSAAILKERIDLARDKYEALETERDKLIAERNSLKNSLAEARSEIEHLNKQLAELAPQSGITPLESRILELLEKQGHPVESDSVARVLGENANKVQYYITNLVKAKLVHASHWTTGQPSTYSLAHLGQEYLIKKGII